MRTVTHGRGLLGRRLVPLEQPAERYDDQEVDDGGQDRERDQRIEEVAVQELRLVDRERETAEVLRTPDRAEQRSDEVLRQSNDERAERGADDDGHRQVDEVAAQQELSESGHG